MADFTPAYEYSIRNEVINYHAPGQVWYSNHPSDHGGATSWGITEATARENGYEYPMESMLEGDARVIYKAAFWRFGGLTNQQVASKLFDAAVNLGVKRAIKLAQRALEFDEEDVDGVIGPKTEAAINNARPDVFLDRLIALLEQRYNKIVENDPDQHVFLKGWLKRAHALPEPS